MDMDVSDAEQVEELAEIAGGFLGELGGERILVVHGDEEHAAPVTQVFAGLTYEAIESLLFDWSSVAETRTSVLLQEHHGRNVLLAPLRDSSGDCLGMLYADSKEAFPDDAVESLTRFTRHYLALLLEICTLRSGSWVAAPIEEEPVPREEGRETDDSWIEESWVEAEDAPEDWQAQGWDPDKEPKPTAEDNLADLLPDLQDYILLDWYR